MSNLLRVNRKMHDEDVIRMNSVGLSLSTIANVLGVHPTTVTLRLKHLGIDPADTRRAFMEDVFKRLSSDQQDWLADQLGPHISIKDFMVNLIAKEYINRTKEGTPNV